MDTEVIKTTLEISAPILSGFLEVFVKPKVLALKRGKGDSQKEVSDFEAIQRYYELNYEKIYYMKTIVFQNKRLELESLYQPLTLSRFDSRKNEKYIIDGLPLELFADESRILVKDVAGMGKSTISKYMFLQAIKLKSFIPIFIELRKIDRNCKIIDHLRSEFGEVGSPIELSVMQRLLKLDNLLIIFDGYDEIPIGHREEVTGDIINFIGRSRKNRYIITSRDDDSLSSFSSFSTFHIEGLNFPEACELLKKYDTEGYHDKIISEISEIDDLEFRKLLKIPLMVSLLYRAYQYQNKIPLKKHLFYKQVFESIFNRHDLSKEGYERDRKTNLDIDQYQSVLRHIAYRSLKDGPSYSREKLVELLNKTKALEIDIDYKASDFIFDSLQAVPIWIHEGNDIRWSHKSLQEYFAALHLCYGLQGDKIDIIRRIFNSPRSKMYANTIDLIYDMEPNLIAMAIIEPILKEYLEHFEALPEYYEKFGEQEKQTRAMLTFESAHIIKFLHGTKGKNLDLAEFSPILESMTLENSTNREYRHTNYVTNLLITHIARESNRKWIFTLLHDKKLPFMRTVSRNLNITDWSKNIKDNQVIVIPASSEDDKSIDAANFSLITNELALGYARRGTFGIIDSDSAREYIKSVKMIESDIDDMEF